MTKRSRDWDEGLSQHLRDPEFAQQFILASLDEGLSLQNRLGPKSKSPTGVDADAFKRADGETVLLHSGWWKVPNHFTADIYQVGDDILIPVSVMVPVPDKHFGNYDIRQEADWGDKLTYVTSILKDKRGRTIGYAVEGHGEITVAEAINLANQGKIDNVVVVKNRNSRVYLRTKKNTTSDDNLTA